MILQIVVLAPFAVALALMAAVPLRRRPFNHQLMLVTVGILIGLSLVLGLIVGGTYRSLPALLVSVGIWLAAMYSASRWFRRWADAYADKQD